MEEKCPEHPLIAFENLPWIFQKKKNPPLVMVATSPEASAEDNDPNPFRSKFIRLRFYSPIPDLDEGRLIATLWGCIRRRVCYSPYTFYDPIPPDLCLDYRDSEGYFISDILDPQIRSFCNMNMDKYMDFVLTYGEGSFFTGCECYNGILYTKQGQCLEYRSGYLKKWIRGEFFERPPPLLVSRYLGIEVAFQEFWIDRAQ